MATSRLHLSCYLLIVTAILLAAVAVSATSSSSVINTSHYAQNEDYHRRLASNCNTGQCYVLAYQHCFHMTSYECNNNVHYDPPAPTPLPTPPTINRKWPVKLIMKNVPRGYKPSMEVRSSILRWASEVLQDKMSEVESLEFIKVEFADKEGNRKLWKSGNLRAGQIRQHRRLARVDVPLLVTVRGPADVQEFALSYIMEIMRSNFKDLVAYLRENWGMLSGNIDGGSNGATGSANVFANVDLGADTFDFDSSDAVNAGFGEEEVYSFTLRPTVEEPSSPTLRPTAPRPAAKIEDELPEKDEKELVATIVDDAATTRVVVLDETTGIAWWVWLIIVVIILLLCICCAYCYCKRCRGKDANHNEKKQEQSINAWMPRPFGADDESYEDFEVSKVPKYATLFRKQQGKTQQQPKCAPWAPTQGGPPRNRIHEHRRRSTRSPGPSAPITSLKSSILKYAPWGQGIQAQEEEVYTPWSTAKGVPKNDHRDQRRSPRHPDPVPRPSMKRSICQTELEEKERHRMEFDDISTIDPPEENVMLTKPVKGYFEDNRKKRNSRDEDRENEGSESRAPEEPDGAKIPKQASMYAAEAMSHSNNSNGGRRRDLMERVGVRSGFQLGNSIKDDMIVCPIDELLEDVSNKRRPGRAPAVEGDMTPMDIDGRSRVRKKKRKSVKKRKKRSSATDKLRSSLTSKRRPPRPRNGDDGSDDDDTLRDIHVDDSHDGRAKELSDNVLPIVPIVHEGGHHNGERKGSKRKKKKKKVASGRKQKKHHDATSGGGKERTRKKETGLSSVSRRLSWNNASGLEDDDGDECDQGRYHPNVDNKEAPLTEHAIDNKDTGHCNRTRKEQREGKGDKRHSSRSKKERRNKKGHTVAD